MDYVKNLKKGKTQITRSVPKKLKGKRGVASPNEDEVGIEQDGSMMDTGDQNIPIHDTVKRDPVLHRMEDQMMRMEGMLGQMMERMARLEREMEGYRTRLEYQSKQVEQYLTTMQHTHLQHEQETQTGLENEVKRLQKELAAFQQNTHQREQKGMEHRTSSDQLQRLGNELELSLQRERARERQYQTDLENAEIKYQTEIAKLVNEVASSKEETDTLRNLVEQSTTEKQRNTTEQARAWRMAASKTEGRLREVERERDSLKTRNVALVMQIGEKSNASVSKVRQLEKEKQEAVRAAGAATQEYGNLSTRYRQLELQLDETKRKLEQATSHRDHVQNLLTLRTGELKGAQAFLGTADQFAGADLIKDLEQLNAEIMQLAASVADELVTKSKPVMPTEEDQERARKLLGRQLAGLLTSSTIHDAQIVIQTAFQTAIAAHAHRIVSAWLFEGHESEGTINRMYESVRNAGKLQHHL